MTETASVSEGNSALNTSESMYDVIVVGAGFSGVHQLRHLRNKGFSVILVEATNSLGGTWSRNRYPGARVDSHAPVYQFTDEYLWSDWDFSQMFPNHEELRQYFEYVDSKLDLSKDCLFNTKVTGAAFDEDDRTWTVELHNGQTLTTRFLVSATGSTTEPYTPDFPNMETFQGTLVHTARWPEGLDMSGQRVAVIGTGASAIQVIQEAGPVAQHLTVFQRTPNLSLPMQQRNFDDRDKAALKAQMREVAEKCPNTFGAIDYDFDPRRGVETSPYEREELFEYLWRKGGFAFWLGNFSDYLFNSDTNALVYDFWKRKIKPQIADPEKAELLVPEIAPHPLGAKRPALHQNYYEVMNQDNVEIVSTAGNPIRGFYSDGIRTDDGVEHGKFDIVVVATGFDNNTGALTAINIRNAAGETLKEKWEDGVDAYLGTTTSGFPNLMFLYGPQSPAAFVNGSTNAELQGDVVIEFIEFLATNGYTRVEPTQAADEWWTAHISETNEMALFKEADSWYMGRNIPGKKAQLLQYPNGIPVFLDHWRKEKDGKYQLGFDYS